VNYLKDKRTANGVVCLLMSNLFFWYYEAMGNCRNLTYDDIYNFPICNNKVLLEIAQKTEPLMCDIQKNAKRKVRNQKKTGKVEYDEYYIKESKTYIDEIDTILAAHYGFTEEELDFIINYDIKYRMGKELLNNENEKENEQLIKNNNSFLK
jgi:hypothetical protein